MHGLFGMLVHRILLDRIDLRKKNKKHIFWLPEHEGRNLWQVLDDLTPPIHSINVEYFQGKIKHLIEPPPSG